MKKYLKERLAKDFMTKKVITLKPEMTVHEIFKIFLKNKIMGAPVVDKGDMVIGMVTERDLAVREEDIEVPASFNLLGSIIYLGDLGKFEGLMKKKFGQMAMDIMSKPPLVLNENASLAEILNLMDQHNINRVPIVDEKSKLAGIVTRTNILKEITKEGKAL